MAIHSEYKKIADKVKKIILEHKDEKVIRINNILSRLFDNKTTDELIDNNYNLERALQCNPLDNIKGVFAYDLIQGQSITRGWRSYSLYTSIVVYKRPCKEFESLKKFLAKYGKYELYIDTFYYNRIFGKRECKEILDSNLLAYDPSECKKILEWLRTNKATKYKICIEERHTIERDEHAYRAETEWYGNEDNSMKITLKSKAREKTINVNTFTLY